MELAVCITGAVFVALYLIGRRSLTWLRIAIAAVMCALAVLVVVFAWAWSSYNIDSGQPYDGDKTFATVWSVVTAVAIALTFAAAGWERRRETLSWVAMGWGVAIIWLSFVLLLAT